MLVYMCFVFVYVCMYVCMYVCVYVHNNVCMYVLCIRVYMYICMYVHNNVSMTYKVLCMLRRYERMYVCALYSRMHVSKYVCISVLVSHTRY